MPEFHFSNYSTKVEKDSHFPLKEDDNYYRLGLSSNCKKIQAKTVEQAIKIFKIQVLFPEQYVDTSFVEESKSCYDSKGLEPKYDIKFKEGTIPMIYVYQKREITYLEPDFSSYRFDPEFKIKTSNYYEKVAELYLHDCIDADFKDMLPTPKGLLTSDIKTKSDSKSVLPFIGDKQSVKHMTKVEMRNVMIMSRKQRMELIEQQNKLAELTKALEEELAEKYKLLYILEVFNGMKEDVVGLLAGSNAPNSEPLYLYQTKCYMDEETGFYAEIGGMDRENIEDFDDWIVEHYKEYMYKPKSIMVWQVRRNNKEYSSNAWVNDMINKNIGNHITYFLIRNGDNLYRIWSDVHTPEYLIPRKDEFDSVYERMKDYDIDKINEEIKEKRESYVYSFLAIQGLIERTDILGDNLRGTCHLMKGVLGDNIKVIYDAEPENWIGHDKYGSWEDFLKRNRSTIQPGTRIMLTSTSYTFGNSYDRHDRDRRTVPFNVSSLPSEKEIYIVDADNKNDSFPYEAKYADYKIKYHDSSSWNERKRRVPYYFSEDECLNIDNITVEEILHYRNGRQYRYDYLRLIKYMENLLKIKQQEFEDEKHFKELLVKQSGKSEDKVQQAIDWWKLKNCWKRALNVDEKKAYRMIIKKLRHF